jgi:CheY-like chemotaxis protein
VRSEPGEGSVFTCVIPFEKAEPPPADESENARNGKREKRSAARRQTSSDSKIKALLVEDNAINQKLATAVLSKLGCDVDLAENGVVGVEKAKNNDYDIIFMDCQMPEMNGFDATKAIREHEKATGKKEKVPIVAMTANAMPGDRERCIDSGMDDYISKPVKKEKLAQILAKYTD